MLRYEEAATRLENRGSDPPTREYVEALVEGIVEAGVEACWHSAVDPLGTPLFPSKVFPAHHPAASLEAFRTLIDRLHAVGRPVLSWYPLNLGGGVLAEHPDWRMEFCDWEGVEPSAEWENRYACINSPYGTLLPRFAVEVVRDVGFDGLWFDGSTMSNHNTTPAFQPGCRCRRCAERFRRDTGFEIPRRVDFSSREFRMWVNWRYDVLMGAWKAIVDAVTAAQPAAVVCFNNYRRRNPLTLAWNTAIPLRTLGLDALLSSELDGFPGQADIQMKIGRAYGCTRGVESWWPLNDHANVWVPDIEPLTAIQASLGCLAAGGVASMGVGVEAKMVAPVLRAVQEHARPRMAFVGGATVEYAAILASQQTMDFAGTPHEAWDGIHGANEFCRHAHLQSSVVFDDHVARGELDRYPVLLVGNAACLGREQARAIEAYVRGGGVLVACREVGTRDELGFPHPTPVLDDLLGITTRGPGRGVPTLEVVSDRVRAACGSFVTFRGDHVLAMPTHDVELIALTVDRTTGSWEGTGGEPAAPRSPGCWVRNVGSGQVVYLGVDCFRVYLQAPVPHMARFLSAVLVGLRKPAVTLDGPLCVTVNTRIQADGRWAVHLHNAPGSLYAYPAPQNSTCLHTPGEVPPVHDLVIRVDGRRVRRAWSGLSGGTLAVEEGSRVRVPVLALHDVVLLDC